jgi:hypothetical protein
MVAELVAEQPRLSVAVTVRVIGCPLLSAVKLTALPFCDVIVPLVMDQVTLFQVIQVLFGSGTSMNASFVEPAAQMAGWWT